LLAGRLTRLATTRGRLKRLARNVLLRLLGLNPVARRRIAMNLSGLARAEFSRVPPARPALPVSSSSLGKDRLNLAA
jgi:hypothetical protein